MYELKMYKKKVPKKKSTVDFTQEAYDELQNFKKRMNMDASNSTIINEMLLIFLHLPENTKNLLIADCQEQIKKQKQLYASVSEQEEIEGIDREIERYNRLMAFLQPNRQQSMGWNIPSQITLPLISPDRNIGWGFFYQKTVFPWKNYRF